MRKADGRLHRGETHRYGILLNYIASFLTFMIALCHVAGAAFADTLTGTVLDDETGKPVAGASVYLTGKRIGGISSGDGRFSLSFTGTGKDSLRCGRIDYETVTIPVIIPGDITVRLRPELHILDTVEVKASRPDELPPHERTSASVNVVTKEEMSERAVTVDEVLDSEVGVDIRSLGGTGSKSEISIRGSTTEQVSVYVDGVPLTAGGSGMSGLSFVPLSQVDRIEVYRGASPGTFGAGAIGGVINIATARAATGAEVDASLSYGSFGTSHQRFMAGYGANAHRFLLTGGHNTGNNDFRYFDDRGTTIDTSDDGWETRENSDYESYDLMARWDADVAPGHTLMAKAASTDNERGVSGLGRRPARYARLSTKDLLFQARHSYRETIDTQAWFLRENKEFYDPEDEAGRRGRQDTDDKIEVAGIRSHLKAVAGPALIHADIELKRETFSASDAFDTAVTPPSHRNEAGAGLESEIMLLDGGLWLTPRIHVTYVEDELQDTGVLLAHSESDSAITVDRSTTTLSLGMRYHATSTFILRANAGLFSRLPEFNELFGDTGDIVGNTTLDEERGTNFDAGFHYSPESLPFDLDTVAFYRRAEDLIQRRNYGDYLISENIGKAAITGIETRTGSRFLNDRASLRLSLAWQDAVNRSDETVFRKDRYYGKQLPYHPEWKGAATAGWRFSDRFDALWKTDYESECFKGPSNLSGEKLESRTIHSLILRTGLAAGFDAVFEAANLTDDHAPDRWGYPKPGRAYYVTVKYAWEER